MHPYERIRAEFLRRINDHRWPAGFALPREDTLAIEFGVARGTIRRAMESLVEAGLIERRRRAGSRVAVTGVHCSTLVIPLARRQIEETGARYGYRLVASEAAGPEADFGAARLRRVVCLHLADDRPWQLEDRLINLDAIPEAEAETFETVSPNAWLVARIPYSAVDTRLRAEAPGPDDAARLALAPGEPVFVIERRTRFRDAPMTRARLVHPGDRFEIVTRTGDLD